MIERNEPAFVALLEKITRDRGFRCASYKDKCLQRRVAVRMRAKGTFTYREYSAVLDDDPHEYERLLDALTINVTKFFRNWDVWSMLERNVMPEMWSLHDRKINVWSAGCSSGEEAYSAAILFHRQAENAGEVNRLSRVKVLGTDIDGECLAAAQRAHYAAASFVDTPPAIRERYFPLVAALRSVVPQVRRMVHFENHDLLREPPPMQHLHMLICRNVIIYFDRRAQERLFGMFREALQPGGILVLGKVETLLGHAREWFTPVSSRERIFRRI